MPSLPTLPDGDGRLLPPDSAAASEDGGSAGSMDRCLLFIGVAIWTRPMDRDRGRAAGTGVRTMAGPPPSCSSTKLTSASALSVNSGSIHRDDLRTRARIWTQPDSPVIVVIFSCVSPPPCTL